MAKQVFSAGRVAVITGAASGIGFAMARHCAKLGMRVFLVDIHAKDLENAVKTVSEISDPSLVASKLLDVGDLAAVQSLQKEVYATFGEVALLMPNAGVFGMGPLGPEMPEKWRRVMNVNVWGVINFVQVFAEHMIAQGTEAIIMATGSPRGLTNNPSDAGGGLSYSMTKAAVRTFMEGLATNLREREGCKVSAHLLVPGLTNTEIQRKALEAERGAPVDVNDKSVLMSEAKPVPGAWMPADVVDFAVERLQEGKFYILAGAEPEVGIMLKQIRWGADDVALGRPALSRFHPDFRSEEQEFMAKPLSF